MAEIQVRAEERGDGWRCEAVVSEGGGETRHVVAVSREAYERLSGGACGVAELVEASFGFLLEREPKESILGEFAIEVIGRYFPEYEAEVRRRVGG